MPTTKSLNGSYPPPCSPRVRSTRLRRWLWADGEGASRSSTRARVVFVVIIIIIAVVVWSSSPSRAGKSDVMFHYALRCGAERNNPRPRSMHPIEEEPPSLPTRLPPRCSGRRREGWVESIREHSYIREKSMALLPAAGRSAIHIHTLIHARRRRRCRRRRRRQRRPRARPVKGCVLTRINARATGNCLPCLPACMGTYSMGGKRGVH